MLIKNEDQREKDLNVDVDLQDIMADKTKRAKNCGDNFNNDINENHLPKGINHKDKGVETVNGLVNGHTEPKEIVAKDEKNENDIQNEAQENDAIPKGPATDRRTSPITRIDNAIKTLKGELVSTHKYTN